MNKYYIAYGSNLNLAKMNCRCPNATVIGKAKLRKKQLVFKGNQTGYLTLENVNTLKTVPICIFKIDEVDEINLDAYEGFPNFYHKEYVKVRIGLKTVNALVYIMNDEYDYTMSSENYVLACTKGYSDFGFDINILKECLYRTERNIVNKSIITNDSNSRIKSLKK